MMFVILISGITKEENAALGIAHAYDLQVTEC